MDQAPLFDPAVLREIVRRRFPGAGEPRLQIRPLSGGLESRSVLVVRAHIAGAAGRGRTITFVAKHLHSWLTREADIYLALVRLSPRFASAWIGVEPLAGPDRLLLLKLVRPVQVWPWRQSATAGGVLAHLAALHAEPSLTAALTSLPWSYEEELLVRAPRTLASLEALPAQVDPLLRRALPAARRMVVGLPELRRRLVAHPRYGQAFLHGDLHSGNVILTGRSTHGRVVLLDWSRARMGSVLEDVSSWTQSLGIWEPEACRRHDSLIASYLRARFGSARLDEELRAHYWLAASSNVLAGALEHHLQVLRSAPPGSHQFQAALASSRAAARALRRADAYWR